MTLSDQCDAVNLLASSGCRAFLIYSLPSLPLAFVSLLLTPFTHPPGEG